MEIVKSEHPASFNTDTWFTDFHDIEYNRDSCFGSFSDPWTLVYPYSACYENNGPFTVSDLNIFQDESSSTSTSPTLSQSSLDGEDLETKPPRSNPGPIRSPRNSIALESSMSILPSSKGNIKCTRSGCGKTFRIKCQWQRHLDNHDKPFACSFPACERHFGSKADLERHFREVHERDDEAQNHLCPEPKCKRHRIGFSRKWNLQDHCRRIHRKELSSMYSDDAEFLGSDSVTSDGDTSSSSIASSTSDLSMDLDHGSSSEFLYKHRQGMQESLEKLEEERKAIDTKISALRTAIGVLAPKLSRQT